jgi:hypothetical protein
MKVRDAKEQRRVVGLSDSGEETEITQVCRITAHKLRYLGIVATGKFVEDRGMDQKYTWVNLMKKQGLSCTPF